MPQWGNTDEYADAPKSQADDKGNTGQDLYGTEVFGVDAQEVAAGSATHSGWVRRVAGTGGRSGRVQEEVLVAMSGKTFSKNDAGDYLDVTDFANTTPGAANTTGTADDTEYPDA
jgi:hypothetical protein